MTELRFYCFVNFYLSQIQQGIQTGHASVRLVRKYKDPDSEMQIFSDAYYDKIEMVDNWADKHETYIILNGGDSTGIDAAHNIIAATDLPFAEFYESKESLAGIKTCVGAVIPDYIFNAKFDQIQTRKNTDNENQLAKLGAVLTYPIGSPVYSCKILNEDGSATDYTYKPGDKYYELVTLLRNSRLA